MLLFKNNLLILFILSLSFISINCHLNDTEITTTDSLIDNEGSSIDADEPSEHSNDNTEIKDQSSSSSLPPSSSTSAAKNLDETRTQPTPTDDIKDDENNSATNNKAENNNGSNDDSLFSISPGASSSSPLDKSGNEDKLVANDNDANENDEDNENDNSPADNSPSSTESSKKADTESKSSTSKVNYEECVALGNENCGTPPEDSESSEESDLPKLNTNNNSNNNDNKPKQPNETSINNNQINSDESKSNEAQEQKTKHFWYEDVPLKLGLPFVLVLFVLFVIIFLLFLVFLIQDSFSRKADGQNNETIKIKTGHGTQKFNLNQLQMLEKRMRAAREDVNLEEVNVQSFNNKKDDSDDQNNNVPNENAFENLQDKQNSSRM